jgi:hypothetical protein
MKTIDNDRELRKLMKGISLDKPSYDFSSKVMEAVYAEAARRAAYKSEPFLGTKFWIFVALFTLLAVALILISGSDYSANSTITEGLIEKFPGTDLSQVKGGFSRFWDMVSGFPITIGAILVASSLLILIDKIFSSTVSHDPVKPAQ